METATETKTEVKMREELIEQGSDEEAVDAFISLGYKLENFDEAYLGQFSNDEDFAREIAAITGELPNEHLWPMYCIDWEWATRELMNDYTEENGYYFRIS